MSTGRESVCCFDIDKVRAKLSEGINCITAVEGFSSVCTDVHVIETAFHAYLKEFGPIDDEPRNE